MIPGVEGNGELGCDLKAEPVGKHDVLNKGNERKEVKLRLTLRFPP